MAKVINTDTTATAKSGSVCLKLKPHGLDGRGIVAVLITHAPFC